MVKSAINFLFENSIFLIVGAIVALVWANTDNETYKALLHLPLFENGFFYDHNYFNEQVSAGDLAFSLCAQRGHRLVGHVDHGCGIEGGGTEGHL